ncbi:DNA polymerase III subunit delta [Acetivibrio ethanolgignens]|uniref:DNA polymerase III subunit delta n=1 Tax=Acetivibrio ethanolgignens TaxID=290052 RepID=A0A0V8QBV8_9FIRM|nr:DNA polymerase III subunit delta [Acetivibrio ethanolgignens]KSV57978.1 DNA polymerase III subunit delta [Acetivibrio ethanolgignens]
MQKIKEHIKNNEYKPVYLLCGTEDYLKKLYQDKLKAGILAGSDDMNYSYFEGKETEPLKIMEAADTLPFFSEHRLICVKNSGLFKSSNDLADYLKTMPDSTHIVFVEKEVDKRNRLYKAVKELGYISEMNGMDERNLKLWVSTTLKASGKKITESSALYFLNKCGTDMVLLSQELEKLICYAYDRDVIKNEDIDAVCTTLVTGKVFQMIDAIASGRQGQALTLYYDLLTLREKPLSILFLLSRQFNILLQVKELSGHGYNNSIIASKVSLPPFAVNKYIAQAKNFSKTRLIEALEACASIEEQIKTGRLNETMGIELLIVSYSRSA